MEWKGKKNFLGDLVCPSSEMAVLFLSGLLEVTYSHCRELEYFECCGDGKRRGTFGPTVRELPEVFHLTMLVPLLC